jgi:hypothetical protein
MTNTQGGEKGREGKREEWKKAIRDVTKKEGKEQLRKAGRKER